MTTGLQVAGIAKHYGATIALDGVDLTVRPGEVLAQHGGSELGAGGLGEGVVLGHCQERGDLGHREGRAHRRHRRWGALPMRPARRWRIVGAMTTNTTSPSSCCANSVMPSTQRSSSMRSHSCSLE